MLKTLLMEKHWQFPFNFSWTWCRLILGACKLQKWHH